MCTSLEGNVCGDYGIAAGANGSSVCYENEEHRGDLGSGEVYSVAAWSTGRDSSMRAECFFWCTGGGGPPSAKGETDRDLIEALVSGKRQ